MTDPCVLAGPNRRAIAALALAAAALSLPGCCMQASRTESGRSRAFVADSFGRRTAADLTATSRRFTTLHCFLAEEWRTSKRELAGTCELVDGRR